MRRWNWAELFKFYDETFPRKENVPPLPADRPLLPEAPPQRASIAAPVPAPYPQPFTPSQPQLQRGSNWGFQTGPTIRTAGGSVYGNPAPPQPPQSTFTTQAADAGGNPPSLVFKVPDAYSTNTLGQTTVSSQFKPLRVEALPPYFRKLKESPFRSVVSEFELLVDNRPQNLESESWEILLERAKLMNLLYILKKIDTFGFLDSLRIQEVMLAGMKKARSISLNLKIKLGSMNADCFSDVVREPESTRHIVNTDLEAFNATFLKFIESCELKAEQREASSPTMRDPRHQIIKQQIVRIFEFDTGYFQATLLETARVLFDATKSDHAANSYAQIRHYQMICYVLDCLLIDSLVKLFFDPWARPSEQKYFQLVDRMAGPDLHVLVVGKLDYITSNSNLN